METLRLAAYQPGDERDLAAVLNAAYGTLRELPRLDVEGDEHPDLRPDDLAPALAEGRLWPAGSVVARMAGTPVTAALMELDADAQRGVVRRLGTHPAHWGRGCAREVLRAVEAAARQAGVKRLEVAHAVDSRRPAGSRLLEHHGFARPNPEGEHITMVLDLEAYQPLAPTLPAGYTIRSFRRGEEPRWVALKNRVFDDGATVEWFAQRFGNLPNFDPASWFIAERRGEWVGMASVITWYDDGALARPRGAVIEWVGVVEEERGRGLGEGLMRTCLNVAHASRPWPLILITQPFRQPAVALYRKLGFEIAREHRVYAKNL